MWSVAKQIQEPEHRGFEAEILMGSRHRKGGMWFFGQQIEILIANFTIIFPLNI